LYTINKNCSGVSYEVIVVDNENDRSLRDYLLKENNTTYILSKKNLGFGGEITWEKGTQRENFFSF